MGRHKKVVIDSDTQESEVEITQNRRVVEAKHTIQYLEPVALPLLDEIEEPEANETEEPEADDIEYEDPPRRRTNALSFRAKLKKELSDRGIGGEEQLRLKVERLPLYNLNGQTGVNAAKEFVRSFACQKEWVFSDDYLEEIAKACGPGAYWLTLRHKNTIVKTWDIQISGTPITVAATAAPGEATAQLNPITSMPAYPQQFPPQQPPAPPRTFKQELKEFVETQRLMKELSGGAPAEPSPPSQTDPEVTLLTFLARDESVMDKLSKGLLGKILGKNSEDRNEWAEVAMEAVKTGQAAQIISSAINSFVTAFSNLIPKGATSGQTQMGAPSLANNRQPYNGQSEGQTDRPEISGRETEVTETNAPVLPPGETQPLPAPEDQLLAFVLDQCARRVPPRIVLDRVLRFADEINAKAPAQSVDGYLEMFAEADPAIALEFIKSRVANGEQITSLPHTLLWTTELQQLLREALTPEEVDE